MHFQFLSFRFSSAGQCYFEIIPFPYRSFALTGHRNPVKSQILEQQPKVHRRDLFRARCRKTDEPRFFGFMKFSLEIYIFYDIEDMKLINPTYNETWSNRIEYFFHQQTDLVLIG